MGSPPPQTTWLQFWKLPELFNSESELRTLWANPLTRKDLLEKLEREGCHVDDLRKLQELIDAKNSDIFDVLEYIAYSKKPISRELRVETNRSKILNFLNFIIKKICLLML